MVSSFTFVIAVMEYLSTTGVQYNTCVLTDKYYHPVVSFLVFACGDYLGRIFSGSLKLVCELK